MQDIRTVTLSVPDIKNAECERRVRAAFRGTEGILADSAKFNTGSVTVTYDSMKLRIKNIEFVIANVGFSADDIPANPAARAALPPECR